MTEGRVPPRREQFDLIVQGWGSDNRADLEARIDLAKEFQDQSGPFSGPEAKIVRAMEARHVAFRISAGELEPVK